MKLGELYDRIYPVNHLVTLIATHINPFEAAGCTICVRVETGISVNQAFDPRPLYVDTMLQRRLD